MNETLLTIAIIGAVGIGAFVIYRHMNAQTVILAPQEPIYSGNNVQGYAQAASTLLGAL